MSKAPFQSTGPLKGPEPPGGSKGPIALMGKV